MGESKKVSNPQRRKQIYKPNTNHLLKDVRPLTDKEKRKYAREWADNSLAKLLEYSASDTVFARDFCSEIAKKFGPHDELAALLQMHLRAERTGKPTGRNKKWTPAFYHMILTYYEIQIANGTKRIQVLSDIVDMAGFSGKKAIKRAEEKITKARKICAKENTNPLF